MPKGQSLKGYKMTRNRRAILELLVEEGGSLKSKEGRASKMLQDLLDAGTSSAALNAVLRELESLNFIEREIEGRRTFAISITTEGRDAIDAEPAQEKPVTPAPPTTLDEYRQNKAAAAATVDVDSAMQNIEDKWDWKEEENAPPTIPDGIDYEVLLGVFLKAAVRGMQGPSDSELDYYKQQNEMAANRIQELEAERDKFRNEAAAAIGERDQLQKNLNILMSKLDKRPARGGDSIRSKLSNEENAMLDGLMRQLPTRRGD